MKNSLKLLIPLFCFVLLFNCEDEDDDGNNDGFQTEVVGPDGILQNLKVTNLNDSGFPWHCFACSFPEINDFEVLKTWNISQDGLIPVKTGDFDLANQALDQIESEVGRTLFDRTSIANTPNNQITRGIIVSEGTALGAFGSTEDPNACGHVSSSIGTTAYPPFEYEVFYDSVTGEYMGYELNDAWYDNMGNINTVLYVHIDAPACANPITLDLVVHEFGHALGMGSHFEGFGFGPAVDGNFWNVLYTMYNNASGTNETDLNINQIKF